jgi:hypothetical protein
VRNKKCLAIAQLQDESLVPRAIIVVGEQTFDEPGALDPASCIAFVGVIADSASTLLLAAPL